MLSDLPGLVLPLLPLLRRNADELDQTGDWPAEDLRLLHGIRILNMALPEARVSALEQHLVYEAVARGSLSAALVLSQRDAAIGLIDASDAPSRGMALDACSRGAMTTVGIAQLTTSRQGGQPAVRATQTPDGYRIDGVIPWCTGADQAGFIVAGAATDDHRQILFLLHANAPGAMVDEPMPLVALRSSRTTSVHCDGVEIPHDFVLRGPADKVLIRDNNLALGQTFLALGLCAGAMDLIHEHKSEMARKTHVRFETQLLELRHRVLELSDPAREQEAIAAAPLIRGECNDLGLRITHAAVALYKGTALLAGHPAQRFAREAMFLLVWSCPNPVIDCTVDILSGDC